MDERDNADLGVSLDSRENLSQISNNFKSLHNGFITHTLWLTRKRFAFNKNIFDCAVVTVIFCLPDYFFPHVQ